MAKKEPKKQLNLRLPKRLIQEIRNLASEHKMKPSAVFLEILKNAVKNRCRRCHGGMAKGGTVMHPIPCPYCGGTGRMDIAKIRMAAGSRAIAETSKDKPGRI